MRKLFVVEYHDQVLDLWREQHFRAKRVLHFDYHCDLRGLLINRKRQRAYRIWDRCPNPGEGNFLTHAVAEGIVKRISWVHDEPGGRQHDLQTVMYETDLTAIAHRCILAVRRAPGFAIEYEVHKSAEWHDNGDGELLDIDWDFLASKEYTLDSVANRVQRFLEHGFRRRPEQAYVCYSPDYVHSTRGVFQRFTRRLAEQLEAEVVDVPAAARRKQGTGAADFPLTETLRRLYYRIGLGLRKRNIY